MTKKTTNTDFQNAKLQAKEVKNALNLPFLTIWKISHRFTGFTTYEFDSDKKPLGFIEMSACIKKTVVCIV